MAYTDNHCDLNKIKDKPIYGFTIRQVICFGIVILVDVPVYAISLASGMDTTVACLIICLISVPIFFTGTFEDVHGRYIEKILKDKIRLYIKTQPNRPFATDNRFGAIQRQIMLEEQYQGYVTDQKKREFIKKKRKEKKTENKIMRFSRKKKESDEKSITA